MSSSSILVRGVHVACRWSSCHMHLLYSRSVGRYTSQRNLPVKAESKNFGSRGARSLLRLEPEFYSRAVRRLEPQRGHQREIILR